MRQPCRFVLLLCLVTGCSTHPCVDVCDYFQPGRLYANKVGPYGGVCIAQGAGPTGTSPTIFNTPLVPPPATLPPSGGPISIPNLPPPPGSVSPLPNINAPPPPSFPTAPAPPQSFPIAPPQR